MAGSRSGCKAPEGSQMVLVGADPDRFFVPRYVGHKGWVGVRLDPEPDWAEIAALVRRSYRLIAPKRLSARISGMGAAAARKLAQDGFNLAILSSSGKGETIAKEMGGIGVTGSNHSPATISSALLIYDGPLGRVRGLPVHPRTTLVEGERFGPVEITDLCR